MDGKHSNTLYISANCSPLLIICPFIEYINRYIDGLLFFIFSMKTLPNFLQRAIEKELQQKRMKNLDMFEHILPDEIVGKIALRLRAKSCGEKEAIYEENDIATELYFQRTGKSQIIENTAGSSSLSASHQIIERGGVFGEDAFLSRYRNHSVLCLTWSEYFVLDIRDISDVLQQNYNPKEASAKWREIIKVVRDRMNGKSKPSKLPKGDHQMRTNFFVKYDTIRDFEQYLPAEDMVTDPHSLHHTSTATKLNQLNHTSTVNSKLMKRGSGRSITGFTAGHGHGSKKSREHDEYEKRLQVEAEQQQIEDRTNAESQKSMAHVMSLFNKKVGMSRESSVVRDRKVVENHQKSRLKSSTYFDRKSERTPSEVDRSDRSSATSRMEMIATDRLERKDKKLQDVDESVDIDEDEDGDIELGGIGLNGCGFGDKLIFGAIHEEQETMGDISTLVEPPSKIKHIGDGNSTHGGGTAPFAGGLARHRSEHEDDTELTETDESHQLSDWNERDESAETNEMAASNGCDENEHGLSPEIGAPDFGHSGKSRVSPMITPMLTPVMTPFGPTMLEANLQNSLDLNVHKDDLKVLKEQVSVS